MKSAKELVAQAGKEIETLSGEDAAKMVGTHGIVFVDVREGEELEKTDKVQGAVHVPRGFWNSRSIPRARRTSRS